MRVAQSPCWLGGGEEHGLLTNRCSSVASGGGAGTAEHRPDALARWVGEGPDPEGPQPSVRLSLTAPEASRRQALVPWLPE